MPDKEEIQDIVEELLARVEEDIEFDGRGL